MEVSLSRSQLHLSTLMCVLVLVICAFLPPELKRWFLGETGPIEIVSALAYLLTIIIALRGFLKTSSPWRYHLLLWAIASLVFFGEETSWLQHYLGFETPEKVKALNAQQEFNLHNLELFHGRKLIKDGTWVELDWTHWLLSSQMLFQLGFASYFFALPVLRKLKSVDDLSHKLGIPRIRFSFLLPVIVSLSLTIVFTLLFKGDAASKSFWAETREMVFALGIFGMIALAVSKS